MNYVTRYWDLVHAYRKIARERQPVCPMCLKRGCLHEEELVGFYDGLALATWWCGLITLEHWRESIVTDNFLYPRFPTPTAGPLVAPRFTPPDVPMSVLILERQDSWGYYNDGREYPELLTKANRFGLGNGAYYGYLTDTFRAVAVFRGGKWYKPKPFIAGYFNRRGTHSLPNLGVVHDNFIVTV